MNKIILAIIFNLFCTFVLSKSSDPFEINHEKSLVNATNIIIRDMFYQPKLQRKLYIISPETSNDFKVSDLKQEIIKSFKPDTDFTLNVVTESNITIREHEKTSFCLILTKDFEDFLRIYNKINPDTFKFNGFYVVIIVGGIIPEIQQIFGLMWKKQIYNVNIILENQYGDIEVKTYMPFNRNNCEDTSPTLINTYRNGRFIRDIKNLWPRKFKNLHRCPVKVAKAIERRHNFTLRPSKKPYSLYYHCNKLMKTLSHHLNFKINHTFIGYEGYFLANGTAEGPLKALLDGDADISSSQWWLKPSRLEFLDATIPFLSEQTVFVIPPGRDLTNFEKLTYAFTTTSWVFIIVCFLIGTFVILIVKRQQKQFQYFIFGTNVQTPITNLFAGFLGQNLSRLPKRNFARFLLMLFLLYSIVIRTLYQGSYFQLLHSNKKIEPVKSIDEMFQNGFKLYIFKGAVDMLKSFTHADRYVQIIVPERLF